MSNFIPNSRYNNDVFKIYNYCVIKRDIINLYNILVSETDVNNSHFYNDHITSLYNEWLIDFKNNDSSRYVKSSCDYFLIKNHFIYDQINDVYKFIFVSQTYFCIILKLLASKSLRQMEYDSKFSMTKMSWSELSSLFLNCNRYFSHFTDQLFDIDCYVWFISVEIRHASTINDVVEDILNELKQIDVLTNAYYSKNFNEQLIYLYYLVVPFGRIGSCKTVNGKDFFEVLDHEIDLESSSNKKVEWKSTKKIVSNLLGTSPDRISLLIAKFSYIITMLYRSKSFNFEESLIFKIYPLVSKSFKNFKFNYKLGSLEVTLETYVGDFIINLSNSFSMNVEFFDEMSNFLNDKKGFNLFWNQICNNFVIIKVKKDDVRKLYEDLMLLRTPIQYDFWSVYIRSKITPLLNLN